MRCPWITQNGVSPKEIPEKFIAPPELCVKIEGFRAIVAQLEAEDAPTAAMLELMQAR
jgi:hypothetical protein